MTKLTRQLAEKITQSLAEALGNTDDLVEHPDERLGDRSPVHPDRRDRQRNRAEQYPQDVRPVLLEPVEGCRECPFDALPVTNDHCGCETDTASQDRENDQLPVALEPVDRAGDNGLDPSPDGFPELLEELSLGRQVDDARDQ